ncbi:MAG: hypothetical protein GF355_11215, partial [Candidatus Eisenbacteria bacterium]|nr:hypothetical protein [Candidatus Eisenbacteria bacterium]
MSSDHSSRFVSGRRLGPAVSLLLLFLWTPRWAAGSPIAFDIPLSGEALVQPGGVVTLPLHIDNASADSLSLTERVKLPEGWISFLPGPQFSLAEGERRARILAVRVPRTAGAASYPLLYELRGGPGNDLLGRKEMAVSVAPQPGLQLRVEDPLGFVAAGRKQDVRLALTNTGNTRMEVALTAESDREAELTLYPDRVDLEPGETRLSLLTLIPGDPPAGRESMTVWIVGSGRAAGRSPVVEKAWFTVQIVPREGRRGQRGVIPGRLGVWGISGAGASGQIELVGKGRLNESYDVAYLLRGPDARDAVAFTQPDAYRLQLRSDRLEATVGDGSWRLSKLMNDYRHGRGAGLAGRFGWVEAGGQLFRTRFETPPEEAAEGYLRAEFSPSVSAQINAMRVQSRAEALQVPFTGLSLSSTVHPGPAAAVYLEYGRGGEENGRSGRTALGRQAYFGQAEGSLGGRVRFALHHIHADPGFHGYYRDLEDTRAVLSALVRRGPTKVRLFARAHQATRNLDLRPELGPAYRRTDIATGAVLRLAGHWFGRLTASRDLTRDRLPGANAYVEASQIEAATGRYFGESGFTVEGRLGRRNRGPSREETVSKGVGFNAHAAPVSALSLSIFGRWSAQSDSPSQLLAEQTSGGGSLNWSPRPGSGLQLGYQFKRTRHLSSRQIDVDVRWPITAT